MVWQIRVLGRLTDQGRDDIAHDMFQTGQHDDTVVADQGRCGRPDGVPSIQHHEHPPGPQRHVVVRIGVEVRAGVRIDLPEIKLHRVAKPYSSTKDLGLRRASQLAFCRRDALAVERDYHHQHSLQAHQVGDC